MARGMRRDLVQRFQRAESEGHLVTAQSSSDARRLRAGVARKELISPVPKVFARTAYWNQLKPPQRALLIMRTLTSLHPTWVFCDISAAIVYKLWVSHPLIGATHVATTRNGRTHDTRGIVRHVMADTSFIEVDGIKVTPLSRTVFDCLRHANFRYGLAIADSSLRTGILSQDELLDGFERASGRFDDKQSAIGIMRLADGRSESGGESVARAVMIERGFRLPELQHIITDPITGSDRRVDFFWEQEGWPNVIGELDGHEKYLNPSMTLGKGVVDVLTDERLRESRISFSNARIVRFSYAQATNAVFFTRLLSAFGVPRDAEIPAVAIDPHDPEALLASTERLFLSRWIEYNASRKALAA